MKDKLYTLGLTSVFCALIYLLGWYSTGYSDLYIINIAIGVAVVFTTVLFLLISLGLSLLLLHFVSEEKGITEYSYEELNEDDAEKLLLIENIIRPMNEKEFLDFLDRDGYGNKNPNEKAILNLLELIKSVDGYKDKEMLIYKKLESLKNG